MCVGEKLLLLLIQLHSRVQWTSRLPFVNCCTLIIELRCYRAGVYLGSAGAVQSSDQGSTSISQGLGSRYASADESRDIRKTCSNCRTGISTVD